MDLKLIKHHYDKFRTTPSDIYEHMETLYEYAKKCDHITEMGVRTVVSTWAFLHAQPKQYVGYDMFEHPNMQAVLDAYPNSEMFITDVLKVDIDETDFLFIDTFHTATQLRKELVKHASKARKYIGFHDTFTFGRIGEQPYEGMGGKGLDCGKGLLFALEEFLAANKQWKIVYQTDKNNGLTIIERND